MLLIESFPKKLLDTFYATFRNTNPVRFLIKIEDVTKLPPGLPGNVKTFSWIPQMQVLSKLKF